MTGDIQKRERAVVAGISIATIPIIVFSVHLLSQGRSVTLAVLMICFSVFCGMGVLLYIATRNRKDLTYGAETVSSKTRIGNAISLGFYALLIAGLIITSKSLYVKPISYYVVMSTAAVLVALQIALIRNQDTRQFSLVLLLQILPLAIVLRSSSLILNPYLMGPDVEYHYHSIENVISDSRLSDATSHYYYYPASYLMQSLSGMVITFSEATFNTINTAISVTSVLVSYVIGKELFGSNRAGLIAALIISVSTMQIFLVDFNTSKIGGAALLMVCVLALVKGSSRKQTSMTIVFWTSAATLFFWHPEISASLIAILSGGYLASAVIGKRLVSEHGLILYLVAFVAYMALIHRSLFGNVIEGLFIETLPGLVQNFEGRSVTFLLVLQLAVAYFGLSVTIFFATSTIIDGIFSHNSRKSFFVSSTLTLMVVPAFGVLSGTYALNPERLFVYFSTMIAVASAGTIVRFLNPRHTFRAFAMLCLIGFLCFASISSYLTGDGNEVFDNTIPRGTTFTTESNLMSHEFLLRLPSNSTVNGDYESLRYTTDSLRGIYDLPGITVEKIPLVDEKAFFVFNYPNLERLVWTGTTWGHQIHNITLTHDLVFDNGDIEIFSGNEELQ